MTSPLFKFANRRGSGSDKLYWGRADLDGAPFRGPYPVDLTEEEFEARTMRVCDPKNAIFDVSDPESNAKYLAVLDGICNGWFTLLLRRWLGEHSTKIYIEWVEVYLEDGSQARARPSPPWMEVPNGQGNGTFPSG